MNEFIRDSIVEHAWHQFLYGYDNQDRKDFLMSMVDNYPAKIDNVEPVAVYVEDYSLPIVESPVKCDTFLVKTIAREYFNVILVDAIVNQTIKQIELEKLNNRMESFIKNVNRIMINPGFDKICSINEFLDILKEARCFYRDEYTKLLQTGTFQGDINSIKLGFVDLNFFARYYKQALNMNRHFSVIIDNQNTGAVVSQQAVNGVVTRRCTMDYSIKIATEPNKWQTYYDLNGQLAEAVHDYSGVELDDCYSKYVKELKNR